jgi:transposase
MIGCDLHDNSMLLKIAVGRGKPWLRAVDNDRNGRVRMISYLKTQARTQGASRIVFAYEASGQGFGLYDQLTRAGIECHVLAPTQMATTPGQRRRKTDERDAQKILDLVRAHELAGVELPAVWIPDPATRDDRELVRTRLDAVEKLAGVRTQMQSLLKRHHLKRPGGLGRGWTGAFVAWLRGLSEAEDGPLGWGGRHGLASLLRQFEFLHEELGRLDRAVAQLAASDRYATAVAELTAIDGVGLMTAMVFLTELGDLRRFRNRRQVAAYLGLVPSCHESGNAKDRKGHITRQGPARVRKLLCQASWVRVRCNEREGRWYQSLKARNPKKTKIAVVAAMRRLGILMWQRAREVPPSMSRNMTPRELIAAPSG